MKLVEKLNLALGQDPAILCKKGEAREHPGSTLPYLESLGLEKRDLRRLEKLGMAVRGYTKNVWFKGELLPNGRAADVTHHGKGHEVRWILIMDEKKPIEEPVNFVKSSKPMSGKESTETPPPSNT